ncbi:ABC transporter permease [Halobacteria archaeon AArc-m2/3/4]|uniref:ABC transporter permease n=1 Tax=Natronoglomus mannanivorans TaxID=2979990 RepID=A0AAP2Z0S1_9EURY|nr:ABC transporter permease [Halobacteria archaeon AArc-xg1-1]MCU4972265.1 ABC transporter permease [Halobacteria archaeon AArc-m2/3/4]
MTLLRYTISRFVQAIPVLIGISFITFVMVNALPGDPVAIMLEGQEVDRETIEAVERRYGLDRPFHERFVTYMLGLVQGDLGYSFHRDMPVSQLMWIRLGPTLMLVFSAFVFALVTAVPLGVLAAKRRNEPTDHVSRLVALVGVSTPSFWIGIMLILIFAVWLGWLPSGRLVYPWRDPAHYGFDGRLELYYQTIRHLLLPMVALGTLQMATIMRIERSSMVESLQEDYVQLARAYGVPERTILRKHAFRAAQLPIITIVGLNLSTALGGAVLIETVFEINGMGRLLIQSIQQLDYQVVMGVTIVLATIFVIGVIITDISYAYVDPRVSYGDRE